MQCCLWLLGKRRSPCSSQGSPKPGEDFFLLLPVLRPKSLGMPRAVSRRAGGIHCKARSLPLQGSRDTKAESCSLSWTALAPSWACLSSGILQAGQCKSELLSQGIQALPRLGPCWRQRPRKGSHLCCPCHGRPQSEGAFLGCWDPLFTVGPCWWAKPTQTFQHWLWLQTFQFSTRKNSDFSFCWEGDGFPWLMYLAQRFSSHGNLSGESETLLSIENPFCPTGSWEVQCKKHHLSSARSWFHTPNLLSLNSAKIRQFPHGQIVFPPKFCSVMLQDL